jgi:hypothetical protein
MIIKRIFGRNYCSCWSVVCDVRWWHMRRRRRLHSFILSHSRPLLSTCTTSTRRAPYSSIRAAPTLTKLTESHTPHHTPQPHPHSDPTGSTTLHHYNGTNAAQSQSQELINVKLFLIGNSSVGKSSLLPISIGCPRMRRTRRSGLTI